MTTLTYSNQFGASDAEWEGGEQAVILKGLRASLPEIPDEVFRNAVILTIRANKNVDRVIKMLPSVHKKRKETITVRCGCGATYTYKYDAQGNIRRHLQTKRHRNYGERCLRLGVNIREITV